MEPENIAYDIRIEQYHAGEISKDAFEKQLSTDSKLKEDYIIYLEDIGLIEHLAKADIRKRTAAALKKHRNRNSLKILLAAFSLLVVVSISAYYLTKDLNSNPDSLYANYYVPAEIQNTRSLTKSSDLDKIFEQASDAYNKKDYAKAATQFKTLADETGFARLDIVYLHLGICSLELGNKQEALKYFGKVDQISYSSDEATWYKALTYLKLNKLESCRDLLKGISTLDAHPYASEARELLDKLNNM